MKQTNKPTSAAKSSASADKNTPAGGQRKISSFFASRPSTPKPVAAEGEGEAAGATASGGPQCAL